MRPLVLLLTSALVASMFSGPSVRAAAASDHLTFTVPVSVAKLHADLTMVRAQCTVFADGNWRSGPNVLGQGASQPYATQVEGGLRAFMGDLDVAVDLDPPGSTAARSYSCALELYNAATQKWSDVETIARHYPIDRTAMAVTSIGGPLR
jgi:hypothetical protein